MVVIPKSVNPKRISENFQAAQVKLDADDMRRLVDIDKGHMLFKVGLMPSHSTMNKCY